MDPERFKRLDELYQVAEGLPPERHARFLDEQCGSDTELRGELEAMLGYRETELEAVLNTPILEPDPGQIEQQEPSPPVRIGRYRVVRQIGAGGMGVVYEAEQEAPRRTVALKVIRPGLASERLLRRFRNEAEVLGQLQHPGIAQIYEAGVAEVETAVGIVGTQPYFAMELVRGRSLTEHAADNRLHTRQRLELMTRICDAVHHAHQNGVIHRDLKPGNILVDHAGQPKILDFGVARVTDSDVRITTLQTDVDQLIGTVPYMSPEQVLGDTRALDTRSDVYSLGTILYELLTGRLPLDVADKPIPEAARVIRDEDPVPLRSTNRRFRGDLETIVAKALEKERARRYQSVSEFAEDIRRYLRDEPIMARPASTFYQLRKFAKRNRRLAVAIVIAFMTLAVGALGTTLGLVRALANERLARRQTYRACIAASTEAVRDDDAATARQYLALAPAEFRGWEWHHLACRTDTSRAVLRGHSDKVTCVGFSPDGRVVASGALDATVRFWHTTTIFEAYAPIVARAGVSSLAFGPDGALIALGLVDGTVEVWDWMRPALTMRLAGPQGRVNAVSFSPSGGRLAAASFDKTVRVWDLGTKKEEMAGTHDDKVTGVTFLPDGIHVASSCWEGHTYLWNVDAGRLVDMTERHVHIIHGIALSSDGTRLATAAGDHTSAVIETGTGKVLHSLRRHAGHVRAVCFSPDGVHLASGSDDLTVRLWELETGKQIAILNGHTAPVVSVAFSPDGKLVTSASDDGTVRLWDVPARRAVAVLSQHERAVYPVAFSPDGSFLVSGSWDTTVRIFDPRTSRQLDLLEGHTKEITGLSISPDSSLIASASADDTIRLWEVNGGSEKACLVGHEDDVYGVSFGPDGRWLVSASWDRTVRIWDAESGREIAKLTGPQEQLWDVAVSPDGRWIASACGDDGTVHLWELREGIVPAPAGVLKGHDARAWSVAFSPDSRKLLSAAADQTLILWNLDTQEVDRVFRGHTGIVYGVAFSPDGSRIASGSDDQTIRLWDPATTEVVAVLRGHSEFVFSVAFSPDGRWLASGSGDGSVRLWDSQPRNGVVPIE